MSPWRDHPRACGEHLCQMFPLSRWLGSSPRLRGTLEHLVDHVAHRGTIPALAGNTRPSFRPVICAWDHPRACGEHPGDVLDASRGMGSSPRLRGTPTALSLAPCRGGIIPALAGNTRMSATVVTSSWDHPRACGEHPATGATRSMARGSSPRLRGTPEKRIRDRQTHGIIPALAGNTPRSVRRTRWRGDHPRACGEHCQPALFCTLWRGSSPRLQGTRVVERLHELAHGIIPALAGNTTVAASRARCGRDHPRACGEHGAGTDAAQITAGSSLRLRGTHRGAHLGESLAGIIPALAGNTITSYETAAGRRDHPRACGEHTSKIFMVSSFLGSSPRLRGTHSTNEHIGRYSGIIPALAGNTRFHSTQCCVTRGHPRACGEHILGRSTRPIVLGSSPRLRGTRVVCRVHGLVCGIIPALAGNTIPFRRAIAR